MTKGLNVGSDGVSRCWWCGDDDFYQGYHDNEWGNPITDDRTLFEKICLEGFQSGLSWITILRKRENFRAGFANFEFRRIAESTINNAKRAIELVGEAGSLSAFFWSFEPDPASRPPVIDHASMSVIGKSPESVALSKALKKRGWSFVGPTTAYAFMQAMGLVNDHLEGCHRRDDLLAARRSLQAGS